MLMIKLTFPLSGDQLFSSNLVQSVDDENGMRGFKCEDVRKEVKRANKLVRIIC